jgi:hypothetical protein
MLSLVKWSFVYSGWYYVHCRYAERRGTVFCRREKWTKNRGALYSNITTSEKNRTVITRWDDERGERNRTLLMNQIQNF